MEMHQLRYFSKVAELGSVTRAAEACFVSQPSLSQQIAKLEQELGQPLFERLGRGVRLTRAGHLFKQYCDQILSLTEDARTRVVDEPDSGHLVVAAIPTVAPYFLPGVLCGFLKEVPRAHVEIREDTTQELLRQLASGDIDLAIIALPIDADQIETTPLFTEELVLAMPAGHPMAHRRRLTMRDLASEPFVVLNEAHCLTGNVLSFCSTQDMVPFVVSRSHQLLTVLELVRLGQGVSLIPKMAVPKGADAGRVYRTLSGDKPSRTIAVAWRKARYQTQLFQRFLTYCRRAGAGAQPGHAVRARRAHQVAERASSLKSGSLGPRDG
ncbi:MAG: LysR family transcriptional regulator [Vicinamibacterales bacterium]